MARCGRLHAGADADRSSSSSISSVPIEQALSERKGGALDRDHIVEVGNLAATSAGSGRALVAAMGRHLHRDGFAWVVFTATRELRNSFGRLGLPLASIARADPARLPDRGESWGRYYDHDPMVVAGDLVEAARQRIAAMKWQAFARGSALADGRGAMSADELASRVAVLSAALQGALPRVRVLGLQADNGADWVVIDLAAQEAGIPLVPLPAFFTRAQCAHAVAATGMDALFSIAPGEAQALGFGEPCALPGVAVPLMRREGQSRVFPPQTTKITFTSGTTGTPKGICLDAQTQWRVAEGLVAALRDVAIERHLCLLPLPVLLENIAGVYAPLLRAATCCVPPLRDVGVRGASSFDPLACLAAIAALRCP